MCTIRVSLCPQTVYGAVVLTITVSQCFMSIVRWVSFDYVVNRANERDIVIRDSFVPTNCLLLTHPTNHETYADFHEFFYKLHSVWKLFNLQSKNCHNVTYRNRKLHLSEGKLQDEPSWKSQRGLVIETSPKKKLLMIDQFKKCSFDFEQARPIECSQHNSFESSIMSSQVVYCSITFWITKMEEIL